MKQHILIQQFKEKMQAILLSLERARLQTRGGLLVSALILLAVGLFQVSTASPGQPQTEDDPVGQGLYVKALRYDTIHKTREEWSKKLNKMVEVPYDSIFPVYYLIPLPDTAKNLTRCDTVDSLRHICQIDSIQIASRVQNGRSVPVYKKDTFYSMQYYVRCYKQDSFPTCDTLTHVYRGHVSDTAHTEDTLRLEFPPKETDTTMMYCTHHTATYYPYAALIQALQDSVRALENLLASLPPGSDTLPRITLDQTKEAIAEKMAEADRGYPRPTRNDPAFNDSIAFDSVYKLFLARLYSDIPNTPGHLRAKIEAYKKLIAKYDAEALATQHYHIDSIDVIATVYKSGSIMYDTFRIRTIPLFYSRQNDTSVQQDKHVILWSGSPYLPKRRDTVFGYGDAEPQALSGAPVDHYVEITYEMPIDAATGIQLTSCEQGFTPGTYSGLIKDRQFNNPEHLQSYVGELIRFSDSLPRKVYPSDGVAFVEAGEPSRRTFNGKPRGYLDTLPVYPTDGPVYIADTNDGDSLLFPIRIVATQMNMDRFMHHPEIACVHYDTIKVIIRKGFKVAGYVSYAGKWLPENEGKPGKNVARVDGDLDIKDEHLPIGRAYVHIMRASDSTILETDTSDAEGWFEFKNLYEGGVPYLITATSPLKLSQYGNVRINSLDATWIQKYVLGTHEKDSHPLETNPKISMWWWAANVDHSIKPVGTHGVDALDATDIQKKIVGTLDVGGLTKEQRNRFSNSGENGYPRDPLDDWAYSWDTIVLINDTQVHVRGVMRGDADRSYHEKSSTTEMQKNRKKDNMPTFGTIKVEGDQRLLNFPVLSKDSGWMQAFQVFLYYKPNKIEPLNAQLPVGFNPAKVNLEMNVDDDLILTTWVSEEPKYIHVGDTLLILNLNLLQNPVGKLAKYFQNDRFNYVVGDSNAHGVRWDIAMPALEIYEPGFLTDSLQRLRWQTGMEEGDTVYDIPDNEIALQAQGKPIDEPSHIISVIPNPIVTWGDVTYYISQSSLVNLKLYSLMGQAVLTFVESERQLGMYRLAMNMQTLPSGVYILRLETTNGGRTEFDVAKIVIKR